MFAAYQLFRYRDYSTQYTDGVTGALIVHGKNESVPSYDAELVVQLSDLYHGFSTNLLRQYLSVSLRMGAAVGSRDMLELVRPFSPFES